MVKLEYIWVDGTTPTKVMKTFIEDVSTCPIWGFDGSSTNQAPGDNSDCVLKPVRLYQNPIDENDIPSFLVLCEVWDVDDKPHDTNNRFGCVYLTSKPFLIKEPMTYNIHDLLSYRGIPNIYLGTL